jgi:hypothetical protein
MKKFNLFNEIITLNKQELFKAINSTRLFGINIKGEIVYEPFGQSEILIYEGKHTPHVDNALMPSKPQTLGEILGKNYQVVEDDDRVLIKAFSNWQALIKVNTPRASYDDTTTDGVDKFADDGLEDIGWQATEFNITYRILVELLEEKCEGTLLCIEQEEPFQFSGLGFLDDNKQAYDVLFNYCQTRINDTIKNYTDKDREILSDDEIETIEFFKCQ